jgi:hypothetical protein
VGALAARRWGPAIGDPTPGIIIDRPDRGRMLAAADDPEERAAIMQFDGGLSWDESKRAAGLYA